MLLTLYAEFFIALSWIFVSNVYSQSPECGYVPAFFQNLNLDGAWPWMVSITQKGRKGIFYPLCNGVLIDRRHVLTAADCFDFEIPVKNLLARIGKMDQNEGEEYEIICIAKHPRYDRRFYYDDIAILTLSRDVNTAGYTPVCLPDDNLTMKRLTGLTFTKTAWGSLKYGGIVNGTLIRSAGLRIISNRDCNKEYGKFMGTYGRPFPGAVSSDMLCTEHRKTNVCGENGGAPLMYNDDSNSWIVVGISIFAYSCSSDEPNGFTRVSEYLEWITENTRDVKGNCS